MENPKTTSDPFRDQIRAAKAEGELAAIKDALAEFAEGNGFNPELEPRELLDKASGAFRSRAAISDMRYDEIRRLKEEIEAMRPRLMPEGMEWLLEVWPKWSNGEYCKFGDWWTADKYGYYEPRQLRRLAFFTPEQLREWGQDEGDNFGYEWDFMRPSDTTYRPDKSEPPAPKVLDADGVEIHEGDTVWAVGDALPSMEVLEIKPDDPDNPEHIVWCGETCGGGLGDAKKWRIADQLTHRAPVIAADGKPLLEGQTVWNEIGLSFKVTATNPKNNSFDAIRDFDGSKCTLNPRIFTHERPDSWERIGKDVSKDVCRYFRHGGEECCGCPASNDSRGCTEVMAEDVLRRCKALAGVERQ